MSTRGPRPERAWKVLRHLWILPLILLARPYASSLTSPGLAPSCDEWVRLADADVRALEDRGEAVLRAHADRVQRLSGLVAAHLRSDPTFANALGAIVRFDQQRGEHDLHVVDWDADPIYADRKPLAKAAVASFKAAMRDFAGLPPALDADVAEFRKLDLPVTIRESKVDGARDDTLTYRLADSRDVRLRITFAAARVLHFEIYDAEGLDLVQTPELGLRAHVYSRFAVRPEDGARSLHGEDFRPNGRPARRFDLRATLGSYYQYQMQRYPVRVAGFPLSSMLGLLLPQACLDSFALPDLKSGHRLFSLWADTDEKALSSLIVLPPTRRWDLDPVMPNLLPPTIGLEHLRSTPLPRDGRSIAEILRPPAAPSSACPTLRARAAEDVRAMRERAHLALRDAPEQAETLRARLVEQFQASAEYRGLPRWPFSSAEKQAEAVARWLRRFRDGSATLESCAPGRVVSPASVRNRNEIEILTCRLAASGVDTRSILTLFDSGNGGITLEIASDAPEAVYFPETAGDSDPEARLLYRLQFDARTGKTASGPDVSGRVRATLNGCTARLVTSALLPERCRVPGDDAEPYDVRAALCRFDARLERRPEPPRR